MVGPSFGDLSGSTLLVWGTPHKRLRGTCREAAALCHSVDGSSLSGGSSRDLLDRGPRGAPFPSFHLDSLWTATWVPSSSLGETYGAAAGVRGNVATLNSSFQPGLNSLRGLVLPWICQGGWPWSEVRRGACSW